MTHHDDNDYNYEEKPKRKRKAGGKVEWSFDFEQLGENIRDFFNSLAGDEEVTESIFTLERDAETTELHLDLDFTIGRGSISALPPGAEFIHADVVHVGEMTFNHSGTGRKRVQLRPQKQRSISAPFQQGIKAFTSHADLRCDVGIAPDIPVTLDVDGGVGPVTLNMMGLRVLHAEIDSGVGSMDIHLPAQTEPVSLDIDSGVGETKITVPAGAHGEIEVDAGVGQVTITVAPNTAVRVRAESGIGSVNIPRSFVKVKGKKEDFISTKGVWQTEGYELAERKLTINYEGGVGSFNLRVAEVV